MQGFVDLYLTLLDHPREHRFEEVLRPALAQARRWVEPWAPLRTLAGSPPGTVPDEVLWDLFALSAIHDKLLLPHMVSAAEYHELFEHLGFELRTPANFDPIFHEITRVSEHGRREDGIRIGRQIWPVVMWGELVFARGGVELACHSSWGLREGVAGCSRLYFANDRPGRACSDLSHGWGSNSRWRTTFHRFYRTERYSVFNADGTVDLAVEPPSSGRNELPIDRRRELLVHRCLVSAPDPDPGPNHWPYDDVLVLDASQPSWPLHSEQMVTRPAIAG